MEKGNRLDPHKSAAHSAEHSAEHDRDVVDYTFRIKIDVSGPPDADAHVRKLIDAEFERLLAAIQQKKK